MRDMMVDVKLKGYAVGEKRVPGERMLIRMQYVGCLFPEHHQVRTTDGEVFAVSEGDWDKLEKTFRSCFLGNTMKLRAT